VGTRPAACRAASPYGIPQAHRWILTVRRRIVAWIVLAVKHAFSVQVFLSSRILGLRPMGSTPGYGELGL
jgi:hypothetical protein